MTGHTGFKGSWLALILTRSGARVTGVALPPSTTPSHFELLGLDQEIESLYCDIRDLEGLQRVFQRVRPEVVIHLAAQAFVRASYLDPHRTFSTNVLGSLNVLECVSRSPDVGALVYVTSDKCYKNKEQMQGYLETDELGGIDPYSASKAAAEHVFASYVSSRFSDSSGVRVASARAGNVVGGGDWSPDRLIPDCIRSIESNSKIEIRHPNATRPWQHVLEPLSGYLRLAVGLLNDEVASGESWNFGPPENSVHRVEEVAKFLASRWGEPERVSVKPDESGMYESGLLQLNCDKAARLLAWRTRWSFESTMLHTVDWYRHFSAGSPAMTLTLADIERYISA